MTNNATGKVVGLVPLIFAVGIVKKTADVTTEKKKRKMKRVS